MGLLVWGYWGRGTVEVLGWRVVPREYWSRGTWMEATLLGVLGWR